MALGFFGNGKGRDGSADAAQADLEMTRKLQEVRGYWESLRRGRDLPERADIDPRGISGALDGAFLLERIAPGTGRLRIAGMTFTDLLGMDARGMPLSAMFDPISRARLSILMEQCFQRPNIQTLTLGSDSGLGRPPMKGKMILLPLSGDGSRGEMVMGCLVVSGEVGRAPRRLVLESAATEPCTPTKPDLSSPTARVEAALTVQAAKVQQPFAVKPTAHSRPYLRLVDLDS